MSRIFIVLSLSLTVPSGVSSLGASNRSVKKSSLFSSPSDRRADPSSTSPQRATRGSSRSSARKKDDTYDWKEKRTRSLSRDAEASTRDRRESSSDIVAGGGINAVRLVSAQKIMEQRVGGERQGWQGLE